MISFIIIGRNIEKTIELSIQSVINFIDLNKIRSSEIIYVDSDSTDQSLNLAKKFEVKIIMLQGNVNAAVGRNEGARAAGGEILFFIDGDMEILPDCYPYFFESESRLVYPFLTGAFANRYYTGDFNSVMNTDHPNITGNPGDFKERYLTGGLFIVEKEYWLKMGGMDTRLCANEDIDFALRLANKGTKQRYYPNLLIAIHHTISYYHIKRFSEFLFTPRSLCSGVLIRKHLLNFNYLPLLFRSRYSMFLLIIGLLLFSVQTGLGGFLIATYLIIQAIRSYVVHKTESNFVNILLYKITYDIYSIIGAIFYYPATKKYRVV